MWKLERLRKHCSEKVSITFSLENILLFWEWGFRSCLTVPFGYPFIPIVVQVSFQRPVDYFRKTWLSNGENEVNEAVVDSSINTLFQP